MMMFTRTEVNRLVQTAIVDAMNAGIEARLQRTSERVDHTELARGEDYWVLEVSKIVDVEDAESGLAESLVSATVETYTAESETIEGCLDKIEKALDRPAPEGE